MSYKTSEGECLAALREAAARLDGPPTKAEYESLEITPSSGTVIRVLKGWNNAKERAGLEINPSRGARAGKPPEGVSGEIRDQWEDLSVDQRWHYRNTEWNNERTLRRRVKHRSWLNDLKSDSGCVQCGESDPACLDFHHTDPGEKDDALTKLVTAGYGKDRLRAECEKCIVLCANCHRKRHFVNPLARFTQKDDA
ncbi:MAG: HNH endonuclease [Halolamina sp.]|uniref:homing endonuclease associated repeat-containing protein n=1 Tax=Halolamina sp. TaxID=1940283 RepID=UPI002FC319AD